MRRDIRRGLQAHGHAMAGVFHLVEVVMLAPTRAGRGFLGQFGEQGVIRESAATVMSYIPLTAKIPLALRQ